MNNENLTPFKMCVINNFPFIEEDFDALNNYQLLCKIVEYLNNVINSQNNVINQVQELNTAFTNLKNYVDNFFDNLDIQDEVNNKLDEMVEDGTLLTIVKPYFDTYIQPQITELSGEVTGFEQSINNTLTTYQGNVDSAIQEQNNTIGQLSNTVGAIATNTPEFVGSTDNMTDDSKVYVLTTNGHIYYYNTGTSAFADSGLTYASDLLNYLSYQGTLTSTDDLNNITANGWYVWGSDSPANSPASGKSGIAINYNVSSYRHYQMVFIYDDTTPAFIRHKKGSTWDVWGSLNPLNAIYNTKNSTITDLNSDLVPGYLFLSSNDNILNKPTGVNNGLLINYNDTSLSSTRHYQLVFDYNGQVYTRNIISGSWQPWKVVSSFNTYEITAPKSLIMNVNGAEFLFGRYTDDTIGLDTYRLSRVQVNGTDVNPAAGDIEGPIKELNAEDFVSGAHGHEELISYKLIIDGNETVLSQATAGRYCFKSIQIYIESTVYSLDDTELAIRNVMIDVTDKVKISQSWKFSKACDIARACCGGLFSSMNTSLNGYSTNLDYQYYDANDLSQGVVISNNEDLTEFKFITNLGKTFIIKTLTPNTTGYVYDYSPGRLKNYFYNIINDTDGVHFAANDVMRASFEIEII